MAGVWGVDPDSLPGPGRSAYELLDSLGQDGGVRALLVMASNLVVSAPRALHVEERLGALDFLCVSDIFLSETALLADVVLPIAQWAEESGTMTNLEGRVIHRKQAAPRPGGGPGETSPARRGARTPPGTSGACRGGLQRDKARIRHFRGQCGHR